jgi:hypothetical protein
VGGPCSTIGEKKNAYRLLVGKPEGKRPLGRPRRRWVDNTVCGKLTSFLYEYILIQKEVSIRMDLGEVGWGDVD